MRAATYIRVSSVEQTKKMGPDMQRTRCRALAEARDWEITQEFADLGLTARNMDRPGLQAMMAAAEAGEFDVLIVYRLDRLARKSRHLQEIWEDHLEAHGVELASTTESIDTSNPMGRAMMGMVGVMAQLESEMIQERTEDGRREKAMQGGFAHFVKCYGFSWEKADKESGRPAHPVIVETEAEVARTIFRLAAEGHSVNHICTTLNANGAQRRGSKRYPRGTWWPAEIHKMLRNPAYMGRFITYTDSETGEETLARPDLCPPAIVDASTWQAAQAVKGPNGKRRRTIKRDYLLAGFVTCAKCGEDRSMTVRQPTDRHSYYACNNIRRRKCDGKHVPSADLDAEVWRQIKELATDPEVLRQAARETREDALPRWRRELVRCGEEMKRWQGRLREARELLETGVYTREDFAATKGEHDAHMEDLRADCERLEAQISGAEAAQERVDWTARALEAAGDLDALDLQAKRRLLAALGVKVKVETFADERGKLIGWTADLETYAAAVPALAEQKSLA